MTSEKEYLRYYSSDKYKQYDKRVIEFIAQILFDKRNQTDNIRQFFRSGYCFYFACILQIAFKRGKICLAT